MQVPFHDLENAVSTTRMISATQISACEVYGAALIWETFLYRRPRNKDI